MPRPRACGELLLVSAFVSPGMEVGVGGGLSAWLPEPRLQVTLKPECLQCITSLSLLPARSFSSSNYAVLSGVWGV